MDWKEGSDDKFQHFFYLYSFFPAPSLSSCLLLLLLLLCILHSLELLVLSWPFVKGASGVFGKEREKNLRSLMWFYVHSVGRVSGR